MHHTLPRELAEFLDFHHYELTHLLQSMSRQFYEEGDKVLSEGHPVVFTPLQVQQHQYMLLLEEVMGCTHARKINVISMPTRCESLCVTS